MKNQTDFIMTVRLTVSNVPIIKLDVYNQYINDEYK